MKPQEGTYIHERKQLTDNEPNVLLGCFAATEASRLSGSLVYQDIYSRIFHTETTLQSKLPIGEEVNRNNKAEIQRQKDSLMLEELNKEFTGAMNEVPK